ncbi:hypothetical protein LILAB_24900 [Corallococcus macrosporus]|uniref:Uncharacterized protein n=1 Tax=Myxococcus fulvus (strain ATCC BAA-855 / HW-1) TaxID=483219 RepID=F8C6T3_MYXFH|nr:hypothetical protein LILAB_24900 [Corallococcus macrosporus]
MPAYNNEPGYTRYAWPFVTQRNARETNSTFCTFDKDHRFYFNAAYFANSANLGNLRVRYQGGGWWPLCNFNGAVDYMTGTVGGYTGTYVRLTLGEHCPSSDILLVAP